MTKVDFDKVDVTKVTFTRVSNLDEYEEDDCK